MKRLFHGSDTVIDMIDLSRCKPGKDFGRGFYLTEDFSKAARMAKRTARINMTSPVVNEFMFDGADTAGLKVKVFERPSAEWAEFVYNNRETDNFVHDYDIIIGPTADDGLKRRLLEFKDGHMDFEDLASMIEYREEDRQYCFCSNESLNFLKKI